jgi:uncharacterized protein
MAIDDNSDQIDQPDHGTVDEAQSETMLSLLEARILGALMEKQLTTPDAYPLTLNSLVLACNQKTSREPIMTLDEGEVQHCLYQLQDRKLVEFDYGSRANKFKQSLTRTFHFNEAEQAIFCILLLRGAQTVNELLSRSRRMHEFENSSEVNELLIKLLSKITPLIKKMPQQPGQREERVMHLLCGEPKVSAMNIPKSSNTTPAPTTELTARIDKLEKQVAWLMEQTKRDDLQED